jgi:predicted phage terminase large subunit-like protein
MSSHLLGYLLAAILSLPGAAEAAITTKMETRGLQTVLAIQNTASTNKLNLIEAKATGTPLQQELRRMSIPVTMYSPGGRRTGTDKVARANAVAPIFEAGMVWAPDTEWAELLVEECAAFPNGDNDDMVDSTTMAMDRFRRGNFISLATDDNEEGEKRELVPEYY